MMKSVVFDQYDYHSNTIFLFKQHLNVHKPHEVFYSHLHLVSCLFWGEYMHRFCCWLSVVWWLLVEDCCLFKLVIIVNEDKTEIVIDWKWRKHWVVLFTFDFFDVSLFFPFVLGLSYSLWFACKKFCKDRVCTASLYDGLEYTNK